MAADVIYPDMGPTCFDTAILGNATSVGYMFSVIHPPPQPGFPAADAGGKKFNSRLVAPTYLCERNALSWAPAIPENGAGRRRSAARSRFRLSAGNTVIHNRCRTGPAISEPADPNRGRQWTGLS